MKKYFLLLIPVICLSSCMKEKTTSHLLEYEINGQVYSFTGTAIRYNDFINDINKGIDWHVFNLGQDALYIQAYDSTFTKLEFTFPAFKADFDVELKNGNSKSYQAVSGEFRLLGINSGELTGDFHFKLKNILDPQDSLMMENGYLRIWLEEYNRYFTKK